MNHVRPNLQVDPHISGPGPARDTQRIVEQRLG
jgi:hypothetical protein